MVGFVVLDVLVWWTLRRSTRYGLWWRLTLDTADVTFWSLSPYPRSGYFDLAVLIAVPLAIESGFRQGRAAVTVIAAVAGVTTIARAGFGRPLLPFTFSWLLLAVGLGIALSRYCRRLQAEAQREHQDRLDAECHRAFLAGQNAVAMGASSIVDAIEGVVPVLGQPPPGSALWQLADGWKAQLGHTTAGSATYLFVALRQWETVHNHHPDLASHVTIYQPEGEGTVLLTGPQVDCLSRSLSRMGLRGPVLARLTDPSASQRTPGGPLGIDVEGHLVEIPADPSRPPRPVDPGPISFVYIAAFLARGAAHNAERVPIPVAAAGVAVCLAAAGWSHIRLRKMAQAARPSILFVGVGVAVAYTVAASLTMQNLFSSEGDRIYGSATGLLLLAFLAGYYHDSLRPGERRAAAAGAGVVCVLGWVLPVGASTPAGLLLALPFAFTPYLPCRHVRRQLGLATERQILETRKHDAVAAAAHSDSAPPRCWPWSGGLAMTPSGNSKQQAGSCTPRNVRPWRHG